MDKAEAIKILKDFHDESAIFSVRTALETLHPELKESEDEKVRKAILELVRQSSEILGIQNQSNMIAWLEKQDPKKHQEELDAAYKTADKVQYHRGYKAAWEEMGEQPPMQNGIIINGVEYELIEDREDDECERCALSDICHDARKEVICNPIFGDLSISHRFEKRKL